MNNTDWTIFGEWPNISWYQTCYNFGLALELKNRVGFELTQLAAEYTNGVNRTYLLDHEWHEAGKYYFSKICDNPLILENDLIKIEAAADRLYKFNNKLLNQNINKFTCNELEEVYQKFHDIQHELWSAGMVPNLLELNHSLLSDYLRRCIGNQLNDEMWHILITPTKLSYVQKEQRDLLKIAGDLEKNPTEPIEDKLQLHTKKYFWVQYGWSGPDLTFDDFKEKIAKLLSGSEGVSAKLKQLEVEDKSTKNIQNQLLLRINLNEKNRILLDLLRRLLFDKAYRVDALYQGYSAIHPVMIKIAKHHSLTFDQLAFIHNNIRPCENLSNKAMDYSIFIKEGDKFNFYFGEEAKIKMVLIKSSLKKPRKDDDLKGQVAYLGCVKGRIKIVLSVSDINKVETGDILVSYATDPSLLPAMEKAAGFITDMGGLTCHAAIVAREMHKPCIVGTKIATKVLKDGDMVEVDANKGIVRKI